jgi:uncharacterized membrane-anchored protein
MSETLRRQHPTAMPLNKVPEVTAYFWIIKILCTSVGESFADYVNETLGFGLGNTTILFGLALTASLAAQFHTRCYTPWAYWLTVVLVSVEGTLLTDNLTDGHNVSLWMSSTAFGALLVAVFAVWYVREHTLSIHAINTRSREGWYWLTVLVTFSLGTALGDWTVESTGWSPGVSVLLPLALTAATAAAWRSGANPVLTFWTAYILTRPLGANIGDYLSSDTSDGGLGLGTAWPSLLFLTAILLVIGYLTITKVDRTENAGDLRADGGLRPEET